MPRRPRRGSPPIGPSAWPQRAHHRGRGYRPLLEHVVPRWKDDGGLHLTALLASRGALAVAGFEPPVGAKLVPVPSLPAAIRRRGFDHAAELSRAIARRAGIRSAKLLRRNPTGRDQRALGRQARRDNVAGSMQARETSGPVIVVDDIVTTGASLAAAVAALRRADVAVLGCVVVGVADRRPARTSSLPPMVGPRE